MKRNLAAIALLATTPALAQIPTLTFTEIGEDHAKIQVNAAAGDLVLMLVNVSLDPESELAATWDATLALYPFLAPSDGTSDWQLGTLRAHVDDMRSSTAPLAAPVWRIADFVTGAANAASPGDFGLVASSGTDTFLKSSTLDPASKLDERYPWHGTGTWLMANNVPTAEFDVVQVARRAVLMAAYNHFAPLEPMDSQIGGLFDLLSSETGFDISFQAVAVKPPANPQTPPKLEISLPRVTKRKSLGPNGNGQRQAEVGYITAMHDPFRDGFTCLACPNELITLELVADVAPGEQVSALVPIDGGHIAVPAEVQPVDPTTGERIAPNFVQFLAPPNMASGYLQIFTPTQLLEPRRAAHYNGIEFYMMSVLLAVLPPQ